MQSFGAISGRDLIYFLKQLGFNGLYSGGKHQYMVRDEFKLTIPNPHQDNVADHQKFK